MVIVNPYINFNGNTEEAFLFYRSVFGGEFTILQRFAGTQGSEQLPAEDLQKIMHISLPIGKGTILMGTDTLQSIGHEEVAGNNFSLCISAETREEADIYFDKLSVNAVITLPLQDMFWGDYFGMLKDQFGIQWMISFNQHQQ